MRIICCLLFLVIGIFALNLPNAYEDETGESVMETALDSLPNIDLLKDKIEPAIQENNIEEALAILEVALEEYPEDRIALEALKKECLEKQAFRDSPLGITTSAIDGFITGRVDNMASLAGSTVGDFFIYGDIRDLTKELLFEKDPDTLIVALSAAGIAAEAIPAFVEAKPAVSMLKVLKKCNSFTRKYADHLLEYLGRIAKSGDVRKLPEVLTPALELGKQSKSFFQFNTLIGACKDTEAVKFITVFVKKSEKAMGNLTHVFAIAGKNNPNMKFEIVDFLGKYGEPGLDYLKKASLKGVNGIAQALKHPWLKAGAKATKKGMALLTDVFKLPMPKWWDDFAREFPTIAKYTKTFVGIICLVSALFFGLYSFAKAMLKMFSLRRKYGTDNIASVEEQITQQGGDPKAPSLEIDEQVKKGMIKFYLILLGIGTCIGLIALLAGGGNPHLNFTLGGMKLDTATSLAEALPLVVIFVLYIPFLVYLYRLAKQKVVAIENNKDYSRQQKLMLLDNADLYFDLPLYCGLAMTILSFIVITLVGASTARLLAYGATLLGILCTVGMRITILSPAKEKLLTRQINSNSSED